MKRKRRSLQSKLFLVLSVCIGSIILIFIIGNNYIYKPFYVFLREASLKNICKDINELEFNTDCASCIIELDRIAAENGINIVLKDPDGKTVYFSSKEFFSNVELEKNNNYFLFSDMRNDMEVREVIDTETSIRYLSLNEQLDNGYEVLLKLPISPVEESVKIANIFLCIIGTMIIIITGFVILIVYKKFIEPIRELEVIAQKMSNLDFSTKYQEKEKSETDEIDNLGKSINLMSLQLEKTIKELQATNLELEKDIEEKSKIDEMRQQFISDVSHELKTPIALIQGYAEGLQENVHSDEESRQFYVDVILDEANKMDKLVKNLLELMKIEYCKREFHNAEFNIVELISEVIRECKVLLEAENVEVEFDASQKCIVNADAFYIEQVITNYLTNAIKNVEERDGEKYIKITLEKNEETNKTKISVFNTGNTIPLDVMNMIWNRFYKGDTSRNREQGGTGIGLAFVKAIMNNYDNRYGIDNKSNGVAFYIEL